MACPHDPVVSLRRYRGEHAAHCHQHAQLLFGWHGRLELELGGRAACVERGAGLIVPPGMAHAYAADREARVWVLDVPAGPGLDRARRFALPPGWAPQADARALLQLAVAAPGLRARRRIDLAQVEQALAGRLHEPWPNARLAALVAMSVPRLHARWLALTGLPPQAWLRQRRLDAAQALLRAGLGLEAAALQVGYASAPALSVALRRERGQGARQLRAVRARGPAAPPSR